MSGYKRVNFYELCRLCASNQQKEKTHIFQEEGRKIQLQTKIQSCLSLTVCENDFLPKVVCGQCLRSLEECYMFRKECVSSESMLSSYFKNFRFTEDFKKSGKVYIKDTAPKLSSNSNVEPVSSTTTNNVGAAVNIVQELLKTTEHIPVYTLQLPVLPSGQVIDDTRSTKNDDGGSDQQLPYGINPLNLASFKNVVQASSSGTKNLDNFSNINGSNDVVYSTQVVDIDSFISPQKKLKTKRRKSPVLNGSKITDDVKPPPTNETYHSYPETTCITTNNCNLNTEPKNLYDPPTNQQQQKQTNYVTNVPADLAKPAKTTPLKLHSCDICHKTFKRREHLYQHVKLHTGYRPFVCGSCSKSFMRKEHLLRHQTSHSGQKNYTCAVCEKSFSRNDNLLKHRKTHEKQNNFRCDVCQKPFVVKHYYMAHKLTHADEKCAWGFMKG